MNIVIVGRFSPPVLACIRSWGRRGNKIGFICIDDGNGLKPRSRYLDGYMTITGKDLYQNSGIFKISSFLGQFNTNVLSCIDDNIACWLSDNAFQFDKKLFPAFPSSQMVKKVLSKTLQIRVATKAGFDVLPEYLIDNDNIETLTIAPEHFPLCLRPSEPHHMVPSFKVKLIHSYFELKEFAKTIHIKKNGKIIGQPFRNLPNLVVHGIRSQKGETKLISAFIIHRKFEGVTLTLQPYPDLNRDLADRCSVFVQLLGLTGNFHFEFLFDPETKQAFFLEINLRFGGTTAKVLSCGYDEPMYALEAYGIESDSHLPVIKQRIVSNKQAVLKYMAKAVCHKLSPLDYPDEAILKKVLTCIKGLFFFHDEVMSLDDFKGSVSLYLNNIIQILKRD